MPQDDNFFASERKLRCSERIMLAVMAVILVVITLVAEG